MESTEQKAVNTLLSQGVKFEIDAKGLGRLFKKKHSFHLRQAYLGTLLILSKYYLKVGFDEKKLVDDPLGVSRLEITKSAKILAMIAAIGILNNKTKIRLFAKPFAKWLLWRLTPNKLYELSMTIVVLNNTGDFINSIRLMSALRVTAPKVENLSPVDQGD
ncbi:MAG: hypothetical protein WC238_04645 [Parcubacteria group bacterium]|jgi:hypothetical protein